MQSANPARNAWSSSGSLAKPSGAVPAAAAVGLGRSYSNLPVRPKLMVLHNLFFLVLTCAVYFTLIPAFEKRVRSAEAVETRLLTDVFMRDAESANIQRGSAAQLQVPHRMIGWLRSHPGEVWRSRSTLVLWDAKTDSYRQLTLPAAEYRDILTGTKTTLFAVLGLLYLLALLLLELVIMPRYVYTPLRLMLDADDASLRRDRQHELIDESLILADEIGTIMRSRNRTVAELRHHEDELEQALAHLEAQDRLASLGLLSASVAHEMNTPLAVLHGSVEKLLETTKKDEPSRERLHRMLRVTERLRTISAGLVDFARVRQDHFEPVRLKPLFQEAWSLVSIDDKAAEIDFQIYTSEDTAVIGNADRLIQVFVNLFRNALQAVSPGGRIEVRTSGLERERQRLVQIQVDDNGPGIPRNVLPNIFDAFVSTRLDAQGTGLGLTVAAGIIQQHGGAIQACNRPGGGARLEVSLPTVAAAG